jgi:hypothetical protein
MHSSHSRLQAFCGTFRGRRSDDPTNRLTANAGAARETGAIAEVDVPLTGGLVFAIIHETTDAVDSLRCGGC